MNNETEMRGCKRIVLSPQGIKEVIAAMEDISKWLTEYLKGKTQYGAFSMSALGEEPVTYFTERAVITFFEGTWKRRKNETTREFLGRIVISDMGHALRKWKKKGEARLCSMDEEGMLRIVEEATQEWEENLLQKEIIRKIGYEIAKEKVKDDPELTKYVNTMEDHNNYLEIARKMRIRITDLKVLEAELLELLNAAT